MFYIVLSRVATQKLNSKRLCDFDFQFNVFLNYSMLDQMSMFFHEEGQAGILSNADDGESTQNSFILPNNGG